jgi:hypothetical protein
MPEVEPIKSKEMFKSKASLERRRALNGNKWKLKTSKSLAP